MEKPDFVGITNRQIKTFESTATLSVWIARGCARVGDYCHVYTENGLAKAKITAISTVDGAILEAHADTQTLITFEGLPKEVIIPCKSIVSTKGYSMEDYSNLPFGLTVDDTFRYKGMCVIVGRISQGTIHRDDKVEISNDNIVFTTLVEDIEQFNHFHEKMSYGEICGLFLYNVPEDVRVRITKGSKVRAISKPDLK